MMGDGAGSGLCAHIRRRKSSETQNQIVLDRCKQRSGDVCVTVNVRTGRLRRLRDSGRCCGVNAVTAATPRACGITEGDHNNRTWKKHRSSCVDMLKLVYVVSLILKRPAFVYSQCHIKRNYTQPPPTWCVFCGTANN